jgi:hypothetical protein
MFATPERYIYRGTTRRRGPHRRQPAQILRIAVLPPILRLVRIMNSKTPVLPNEIESASTARWLSAALAPARARMKLSPTREAIDRMRTRVVSEETIRRRKQRIAA